MTTLLPPYDDHGLGPDDPPHPFLHPVGRFTLACGGLEFWLYYAVTELQLASSDEAAADGSIGRYLERLRALPKRLPLPERPALREALRGADEVTALRNALMHGVTTARNYEVGESWRPHKSRRAPGGHPEGRVVLISRPQLHEAARNCHRLGGLLQANVPIWQEQLGIVDEDDDED